MKRNMAASSDENAMLDVQSAPPSQPAAPIAQPIATLPPAIAETPARPILERPRLGLASRLLLLTIGFAFLTQIMIFVPRMATVRENWLRDRKARQ